MHSKSQQGKDSSKKLTQNLVFLQLLQIQNKRVVLCRNIVDFFFYSIYQIFRLRLLKQLTLIILLIVAFFML